MPVQYNRLSSKLLADISAKINYELNKCHSMIESMKALRSEFRERRERKILTLMRALSFKSRALKILELDALGVDLKK